MRRALVSVCLAWSPMLVACGGGEGVAGEQLETKTLDFGGYARLTETSNTEVDNPHHLAETTDGRLLAYTPNGRLEVVGTDGTLVETLFTLPDSTGNPVQVDSYTEVATAPNGDMYGFKQGVITRIDASLATAETADFAPANNAVMRADASGVSYLQTGNIAAEFLPAKRLSSTLALEWEADPEFADFDGSRTLVALVAGSGANAGELAVLGTGTMSEWVTSQNLEDGKAGFVTRLDTARNTMWSERAPRDDVSVFSAGAFLSNGDLLTLGSRDTSGGKQALHLVVMRWSSSGVIEAKVGYDGMTGLTPFEAVALAGDNVAVALGSPTGTAVGRIIVVDADGDPVAEWNSGMENIRDIHPLRDGGLAVATDQRVVRLAMP